VVGGDRSSIHVDTRRKTYQSYNDFLFFVVLKLFRKKRKKCPGKEKNKQNESNKLPVASAAATAAAAAAALLEAEEDMDSTAPNQYDSDDGLGSYEGIVDPESPVRLEKLISSQKKRKMLWV